jgi:hypothetical protein
VLRVVDTGLAGRSRIRGETRPARHGRADRAERPGLGLRTAHTPRGQFILPAGQNEPGDRLALFAFAHDGIPALALWPEAGPAETLELVTPAHYSVLFDGGAEEWGSKPWVGGSDFYQTFIATAPHITRIATKLADKSGDHCHLTLNYAVYEVGDGPPSTWKLVSPVRSRFLSGGTDPIIHIFHVMYRSSEARLVPGRRYAVRLWRAPQSQSETFALVARPDRGDGYAGGQLYQGDTSRPEWDAYMYVSGGEPGTVVNHAPVEYAELSKLVGSARRYGQTFRASGHGLAAVETIYTTGAASPPALDVRFQLYDRPGGTPIGPARTTRGLPLAFQARAAAAWLPGQAPLTPGEMYYLEWSTELCNTWACGEDLPGEAYRDGKPVPGTDLLMAIAEYEGRTATQAPR